MVNQPNKQTNSHGHQGQSSMVAFGLRFCRGHPRTRFDTEQRSRCIRVCFYLFLFQSLPIYFTELYIFLSLVLILFVLCSFPCFFFLVPLIFSVPFMFVFYQSYVVFRFFFLVLIDSEEGFPAESFIRFFR